jgi:acetyl esterase/lipase
MRFAPALAAALVLALAPSLAAEPLQTTPLSIESIAEHPAISRVTLSPDGKHVAALVRNPKYRWPVVTIWDADNLSKAPIGIPSERMRPILVGFLGNNHVLFVADQPLDYTDIGQAGVTKTFTRKIIVSDLKGSKFTEPFAVRGTLDDFAKDQQRQGVNFEILQDGNLQDENRYLVRSTNLSTFASSIYALDAETLSASRAALEATDEAFILADMRDGQLMVKQTLRSTGDGWRVVREVRNRSTGGWEEHPELGYLIKQRFTVNPLGFFDPDPNKLFVSINKDSNFTTVRIYDIASRTWDPVPAFASNSADVSDVTALVDKDKKAIVGVASYVIDGPARHEVFVDDVWGPIQRGIEAQFPGRNVTFSDPIRKLKRTIVTVSGPTQPPAYFLLVDGRELKLLGKSYPSMDEKTFGDTKYVTYKARDGMIIPGLLTLPKGYDKARHGRIPLVIHPHGGPWARDYISWDSSGWTQFLTTRGYAVLQPQYRGSEGWGMALWKAGDKEWGQKMQDDKDDGAAWLVAEGIADPQRMAIFGYSYGGFAAIAASVRPNSPYRCAIAGAGVANLQRLGNLWGANRIAREAQGWTVKGMDPMDNVAKANIPIMLYHGDRDTQAETRHSRDFYSAMKSAGKDIEYHEIKDMWHQLPWWPEWHRETLGYIENYLAGPKCFGGAKPN